MILEVTDAHYAGEYRIELVFNHTIERLVDLSSELEGEIFEPLHNLEFFQSFFIDCGTISWSNGADIAPEYLYFISKSNSISPTDDEKEIEESVRSLYTLERAG
jgi:hypothetical protein